MAASSWGSGAGASDGPAAACESLRLAISDLAASFPDRYPHAADYLARLDGIVAELTRAPPPAVAAIGVRLAALRREALLANPLLDFDRLLVVRRSTRLLGLPMNWQGNSSLPRRGYSNEIAVLTNLRGGGDLATLYRPPDGAFVGDVDLDFDASRILFSMPAGGAAQRAFYGSNSYWPNAMFYARPVPDDPLRFFAVVGGHHDNPRMGELVLFDTRRGRVEAEGAVQRIPGRGKRVDPILLDGLTKESWPKFLHPWPLSDRHVLVAARPTPGSEWGLYLADTFDNLVLIKELPGEALLEPVPLAARVRPPSPPSRVDAAEKNARCSRCSTVIASAATTGRWPAAPILPADRPSIRPGRRAPTSTARSSRLPTSHCFPMFAGPRSRAICIFSNPPSTMRRRRISCRCCVRAIMASCWSPRHGTGSSRGST